MTNLNFEQISGKLYRATYTTVSDHDVLQIALPDKSFLNVYAKIPNFNGMGGIFSYPRGLSRDAIFTLNVPANLQLIFETSAPVEEAAIMGGE